MKALAKRILPPNVWNGLRRIKNDLADRMTVRHWMEVAGYDVARKADYYSPLTSVSELKANVARWNRPSALSGVAYDLGQMKEELSNLLSQYLDEFSALPPYEQLRQMGFGPGYPAVDTLTLYVMIRSIKPKRYTEIGSGLSTCYCSLAAARNAAEGHPLAITCIEPNPYDRLYTVPGIQLIKKKCRTSTSQPFRSSNATMFSSLIPVTC